MAKTNYTAQAMMKKHGKSVIYQVGKHLYFSKKNALITANDDESLIEEFTADESAPESDDSGNTPKVSKPKKADKVGKGKTEVVSEKDPDADPDKGNDPAQTDNPETV